MITRPDRLKRPDVPGVLRGRLYRLDNRGELGVLVVPLILTAVLLVAALVFGIWAFSGREDYRKNVETKIAAAVKVARQQEGITKDKQHAEADKQPAKTYTGPAQYGSIRVSYPKTWSGYVISNASQPFDGYFQPGVVPNINDNESVYALRVQVLNQSYSSVTSVLDDDVASKKLTATPYAFAKVPNIVGIRYDGAFQAGKKTSGTIIILPLRDKTLQVWTESPVYAADFATYVLPDLTFSP